MAEHWSWPVDVAQLPVGTIEQSGMAGPIAGGHHHVHHINATAATTIITSVSETYIHARRSRRDTSLTKWRGSFRTIAA